MFLAYLFRSDQTGFFLNRIQITPGRVRVKEGFRVVLDLVLVDVQRFTLFHVMVNLYTEQRVQMQSDYEPGPFPVVFRSLPTYRFPNFGRGGVHIDPGHLVRSFRSCELTLTISLSMHRCIHTLGT